MPREKDLGLFDNPLQFSGASLVTLHRQTGVVRHLSQARKPGQRDRGHRPALLFFSFEQGIAYLALFLEIRGLLLLLHLAIDRLLHERWQFRGYLLLGSAKYKGINDFQQLLLLTAVGNHICFAVTGFEMAVLSQDTVVQKIHLRPEIGQGIDRKSTRLNSSHVRISYAVFCLKKKKKTKQTNNN